MYDTKQFRKGLKIEVEGIPYNIVDFQLVSPGKGGSFVRTKMKNMLNGSVLEKTFKTGDKVGKPDLEQLEFQFLYKEGDHHYYFMNTANYEQEFVGEDQVGEGKSFLKENTVCSVLFYRERPIGVTIPTFISLRVVKADPLVKGDTASGDTNPATLETGYVLQVPPYLEEGTLIKVDTRTGAYVERVNE